MRLQAVESGARALQTGVPLGSRSPRLPLESGVPAAPSPWRAVRTGRCLAAGAWRAHVGDSRGDWPDCAQDTSEKPAWNEVCGPSYLPHPRVVSLPLPPESGAELGPGSEIFPPSGSVPSRLSILETGSPDLKIVCIAEQVASSQDSWEQVASCTAAPTSQEKFTSCRQPACEATATFDPRESMAVS